jgi:hypothetical protein
MIDVLTVASFTTYFNIGYCIMLIPSLVVLTYVRPSYWLSGLEITWGILTGKCSIAMFLRVCRRCPHHLLSETYAVTRTHRDHSQRETSLRHTLLPRSMREQCLARHDDDFHALVHAHGISQEDGFLSFMSRCVLPRPVPTLGDRATFIAASFTWPIR